MQTHTQFWTFEVFDADLFRTDMQVYVDTPQRMAWVSKDLAKQHGLVAIRDWVYGERDEWDLNEPYPDACEANFPLTEEENGDLLWYEEHYVLRIYPIEIRAS